MLSVLTDSILVNVIMVKYTVKYTMINSTEVVFKDLSHGLNVPRPSFKKNA